MVSIKQDTAQLVPHLFRSEFRKITTHICHLYGRGILLEMPTGAVLQERLDMVLLTIYLLFTEGYYSETKEELIREDLCFEAMRLAYLLTEQAPTNSPKVRALLALFCFQASRFPARRNKNGEWLLYDQQDASLWDQGLIARGVEWLHKASVGEEFSFYHLEAAIAYWYTRPEDTKEKWAAIVGLYDQLVELKASPVVALNRIFAVYKLRGAKEAIQLADQLQLKDNPYYYMLLGELYSNLDKEYSQECFRKAYQLVNTEADRRFVEKRL
ncbi:hypothetical protein L0U88_13435 [Flavihumibacter sp. RY-1]|uniref:DUF6596 domain-containing protein n=1 Tax=Flavihumibacter fluminis TaxID=2909236 RepID=A0ABS9BIU0_9BACT|nr:DUF6596 domain-containing protein [Flavihumibacter fluminis]MCF1715634.1 hypothetical protein [Flavihumibacter fluminis]